MIEKDQLNDHKEGKPFQELEEETFPVTATFQKY